MDLGSNESRSKQHNSTGARSSDDERSFMKYNLKEIPPEVSHSHVLCIYVKGDAVKSLLLLLLVLVVARLGCDVALREGEGVGERGVEGTLDELGGEDLVATLPVGGDVSEGVGDELHEPVHGDAEAVAAPEEGNATEHNRKGHDNPGLGEGKVDLGVEVDGGKDDGRDGAVHDTNADLVLSVKAEHGLLLVVARGLENVVAGLADDKGEETPVHGSLEGLVHAERVREEDHVVADHKDGGANEVQPLVDEVVVRSMVVNLLLLGDSLPESHVLASDHRLGEVLDIDLLFSSRFGRHCDICVCSRV